MFLIDYKQGTLVLGVRPWDRMYAASISRTIITFWSFDPSPGAPLREPRVSGRR